jgi:hypothetical protein
MYLLKPVPSLIADSSREQFAHCAATITAALVPSPLLEI